jgi:hypothetical protein
MQEVQAEVAKLAPSEGIKVVLMNGDTLNVNIENPVSDIINERQERALQIARTAFHNYSSRGSLKAVNVTIVKRRRYLLVLSWANNASFHFEPPQLAAGAA